MLPPRRVAAILAVVLRSHSHVDRQGSGGAAGRAAQGEGGAGGEVAPHQRARSKMAGDKGELSWLMRTTYISNDAAAPALVRPPPPTPPAPSPPRSPLSPPAGTTRPGESPNDTKVLLAFA